MSLQPRPVGLVPADTARGARAAFPHGTRWLRLRDTRGTIYGGSARGGRCIRR